MLVGFKKQTCSDSFDSIEHIYKLQFKTLILKNNREDFKMSKVSYIQLLKEAISEYDAKAMDYKGPLSEPILTFGGDGELETHKDASSILERYYFNEKQEKLVEQDEVGPENPVDVDPDDDADDPNEILTGEEPDDVDDTMDDFEDEILDEELQLEDWEESDGGPAGNEPDALKSEPLEDDAAEVMNQEMVSLENTVIEKLIQEMENEVPRDEDAGEEAGTDNDEKTVDKVLEDDFDLLEAELELEAEDADQDEETKDKEPEDLDVDKEIGDEDDEPVKKENRRLGPINPGSDHELQEAFRIFEQEIEDVKKDEDEPDEDETDEPDEDEDAKKK